MTDGAASSSSASSVHGAASCSRKRFLELLEPARDQVVLAMNCVFEAEEVEDSSQELAAFWMCQAVRYLKIRPEPILGNDLVEVQVVDVQKGAHAPGWEEQCASCDGDRQELGKAGSPGVPLRIFS